MKRTLLLAAVFGLTAFSVSADPTPPQGHPIVPPTPPATAQKPSAPPQGAPQANTAPPQGTQQAAPQPPKMKRVGGFLIYENPGLADLMLLSLRALKNERVDAIWNEARAAAPIKDLEGNVIYPVAKGTKYPGDLYASRMEVQALREEVKAAHRMVNLALLWIKICLLAGLVLAIIAYMMGRSKTTPMPIKQRVD